MSDDKRLERIEIKIDDINDHLGSINVILGQQHESLKFHIKRTNLLEAELKPIRRHIDMVNGALKLSGLLATILAIFQAARMYFHV